MEEKYLVIYPSGKLSWAKLERKPRYDGIYNGEEALNMDEVRRIIGCDWLKHVQTNIPGVCMMVDEVGKVRQDPKPHNELASQLYYGWNPMGLDDIAGTAVIFSLQPSGPLQELDLFPLTPLQRGLVGSKIGVYLEDVTEEVNQDV